MGEVRIEPFATRGLKVAKQAKTLMELVRANREWLAGSDYAEAIVRYDNDKLPSVRSMHNVRRLGRHHEVHSGILMDDDTPLGIGTAILQQDVAGSPIGLTSCKEFIRGTDVDYWLTGKWAKDGRLHQRAAEAVTRMAADLTPAIDDVFTLLRMDQEHQPDGFAQIYEATGVPSSFRTTDQGRNDTYGITKHGATLQAYVAPLPLRN